MFRCIWYLRILLEILVYLRIFFRCKVNLFRSWILVYGCRVYFASSWEIRAVTSIIHGTIIISMATLISRVHITWIRIIRKGTLQFTQKRMIVVNLKNFIFNIKIYGITVSLKGFVSSEAEFFELRFLASVSCSSLPKIVIWA